MDQVRNFFDLALLKAVLTTSTPLLFAAMGGLLSERSGVVNIALEGLMLIGAFSSAAFTVYTGSAWLGLLLGVVCATAAAVIHAVWCISLRGDQIVAGTALNLLGVGVPAFLLQRIWHISGRTPPGDRLPFVRGISILVPVAFALVPLVQFVLFRTKPGLRIMAAGESPRAAESVGIPVARYRYACVLASGALAGLGGVMLSTGSLGYYTNNMTQGRGFIALAAVIFGNWLPLGALGGTLLFGAAQAIQIQAQAVGVPISKDLILALPYLLTLVAIAGLVRRSAPPAGLGQHAAAE